LKLTRIETFTVVVPLHEGAWHSAGINHAGDSWEHGHWPERQCVLFQLHTDEGLVGVGEVSRGVSALEVEQGAASLIGRELWDINLQSLALDKTWFTDPGVAQGCEMALYDLMGKALGVPVYRLFGGKYRDRVPVSRCSGRMTPADAAKTARQAVDQGYRVLKMKARADDPIVERLSSIHEAVGDKLVVNIDPNERFLQRFRLF
jgi:L-alanine-DL-glutamate epimerase-like enolase superfamily enzyme